MKKYKTILCDPPWTYGKGWGHGAGDYYPIMKLEDICNLNIPSAENAHLYLWCPNGMLKQGLKVMERWNFKQKTCLTWVKNRSIFGYYFKGQTEQLLFGVKGKLPPMDRKQTTLITGKIRRHSEKPDEIYKIIEKLSPAPRLELFARKHMPNWTSIGFDLDGKDIREVLNIKK